MNHRRSILAAVLVACALTASCAWSIGGSEKETTVRRPTIAEELRDLEKARDEGLVSEEEYRATRERILGGKD